MLQKTVFILLLVALSGMLFSGCSPRDDSRQWRFEVKKAPPPYEGALGHDIEIKFISDKNDVVILPFKNPYCIGFMKVLCDSGNGKNRRFVMDFASDVTDYRAYLVDMKGDGDRRHLIVCNYEGGNSAAQYQAFLIDTKDGFKILKEIPAGECPDYPLHNPDLVF